MKVYIFCGKGGVGKTNSAASLALTLSRKGESTAIIDYDGGHSVMRTLGRTSELALNTIHTLDDNLFVVIVDNTTYVGIGSAKERGQKLGEYLKQFPGDAGIIPLADMVNEFFGVPTDVPTLQKFTTLVTVLDDLVKRGCDNVIIDVEPTAGLERLLSNASSTMRSLRNLSRQGIVSLTMLGAKWPDIAGYLKSEYIKQAERYCLRIDRTVRLIKGARFLIVCTPELGPVKQASEVGAIIDRFGGVVCGHIVNNVRGESYEAGNIAQLRRQKKPLVMVNRRNELHVNHCDRTAVLCEIGNSIAALVR